MAGSVDPVEKARETVENLVSPTLSGMACAAEEISRITGAYYDIDKKFVHATGFLIRPDNTIEVACYSSAPPLTAETASLIEKETIFLR